MPVPGFAHGVTSSSYWMSHLNDAHTKTAANSSATKTASADTTKTADSGSSFWDDLLDVVNPLQHLPVVGTVYRSLTGDKIGDVEKVAGDTLYGGPIGLVSSLADLAFEKVTGKDFGDTVMGFVGLGGKDDSTTALAANTPPAEAKPVATATPQPLIATAAPIQLASTSPRIVPAASPVEPQTAKPAKANAPAPSSPAAVVDISANTDALLQALDAYKRTMQLNASPIMPVAN